MLLLKNGFIWCYAALLSLLLVFVGLADDSDVLLLVLPGLLAVLGASELLDVFVPEFVPEFVSELAAACAPLAPLLALSAPRKSVTYQPDPFN